MNTDHQKFIYIGGAEGSGTTLLRRLIAAPECCTSLGFDISKMPDWPDAHSYYNKLIMAGKRLWTLELSPEERPRAKLDWQSAIEDITKRNALSIATHLVMKNSFPFGVPHGVCCPNLRDVTSLEMDTRIVIIYREPCAATYSAYRRGFDPDLMRLAQSCSDHLSLLADQLRGIPSDIVKIISYTALCEEPQKTLAEVAAFCEIPAEPVQQAYRNEPSTENPDKRYLNELSAQESESLETFFNTPRRQLWNDILC